VYRAGQDRGGRRRTDRDGRLVGLTGLLELGEFFVAETGRGFVSHGARGGRVVQTRAA
jgi:hypothetical protein